MHNPTTFSREEKASIRNMVSNQDFEKLYDFDKMTPYVLKSCYRAWRLEKGKDGYRTMFLLTKDGSSVVLHEDSDKELVYINGRRRCLGYENRDNDGWWDNSKEMTNFSTYFGELAVFANKHAK